MTTPHSKPINHEYTDEIVCPWCGTGDGDSWDYPDESDEVVCDDCRKPFHYQRDVTVKYTTEKITVKDES